MWLLQLTYLLYGLLGFSLVPF